MIQPVNKSLINPACLLITLTFTYKETLRAIKYYNRLAYHCPVCYPGTRDNKYILLLIKPNLTRKWCPSWLKFLPFHYKH